MSSRQPVPIRRARVKTGRFSANSRGYFRLIAHYWCIKPGHSFSRVNTSNIMLVLVCVPINPCLTVDYYSISIFMIAWLSAQVRKSLKPRSETETVLDQISNFEAVISTDRLSEFRHLLDCVCKQSFYSDERNLIMHHLESSLRPSNPDWRVILNGLRLLDALCDRGSCLVFQEVSQCSHFDVVQRTLFLLTFSHDDDRITKLMRHTAQQVRAKVLSRFNDSDNEIRASVSYTDKTVVSSGQPSSFAHLVSLRHVEDDQEEPDLVDLL